MPKPWYQRAWQAVFYGAIGFLFAGTVLDAIGNAFQLVTPRVTYVGTAAVLGGYALAYVLVRRHPLRWVYGTSTVTVTAIGFASLWRLVGILILLWLPRLLDSPEQHQSASKSRNIELPGPASDSSDNDPDDIKLSLSVGADETRTKTYTTLIHSSIPKSIFRITVQQPSDLGFSQAIIEISRPGENAPYQTIKPRGELRTSSMSTLPIEDAFFILEDLNFDKYRDFRLMTDLSACCYSYIAYTYDPRRDIFEYNDQLSEVLAFFSDIQLRPQTKEVIRSTHCAPGAMRRVFRWSGNRLEQTKSFTYLDEEWKEVPSWVNCDTPYVPDF